jgi:hypothetical protein
MAEYKFFIDEKDYLIRMDLYDAELSDGKYRPKTARALLDALIRGARSQGVHVVQVIETRQEVEL